MTHRHDIGKPSRINPIVLKSYVEGRARRLLSNNAIGQVAADLRQRSLVRRAYSVPVLGDYPAHIRYSEGS